VHVGIDVVVDAGRVGTVEAALPGLIPTYPGGGIGFLYASDEPWQRGLDRPYPPGVNNYINPDVHRAAFALPEFFRKQLVLGE